MSERVKVTSKKPEAKTENSVSRIKKADSYQSINSPIDSILSLQRTIGNQAVQRLFKSGVIQAKLKIGQPGDIYEQEADRVADAVMRMPEPIIQPKPTCPFTNDSSCGDEEHIQTKPLASRIIPLVQRQPIEEEEEEPIQTNLVDSTQVQRQEEEQGGEVPIMTKALSYGTIQVTDGLRARLNRSKGGGQRLPETDRHFMERRFGVDFSGVRVHTDSNTAQISRELNAKAFTYGRDIYFGAGKYNPDTSSGKILLAHELTHVVQQASSHIIPTIQRKTASKLPMKVVGHSASAAAVKMASERMTEVLGSLLAPSAVDLKGTNVELHIIPHNKKLTDLPEFASLKGKKTFDGRNYDDLRGVGGMKVGTTIRYAVAEEQLVSISGKPSGYSMGFAVAHESGHIVEQFGLTKDQEKELQRAYEARKKAKGPWLNPDWYTSSSTGEYFAQSTAAYFGRPYSTNKTDKLTYTRAWLKKNDPAIYKLLATIYKK